MENANLPTHVTTAITADARHRTTGLAVDAIRHSGLDDLSSLSFHACAGRLDIQQLRALVIGCGESALSLAEQLRSTDSQVVFYDQDGGVEQPTEQGIDGVQLDSCAKVAETEHR